MSASAPKATELLRRREMTRGANSGQRAIPRQAISLFSFNKDDC